jgi:CheY-like chemotaxis protein
MGRIATLAASTAARPPAFFGARCGISSDQRANHDDSSANRFALRSLFGMKAILIVDDDLGFVFWLGILLADGGYAALPAKGTREAVQLLESLDLSVAVLVINPALPGAEGFITSLRASQTHLPIIRVVEPACLATQSAIVGLVLSKPSGADEKAKLSWLRSIQFLLAAKFSDGG